MSAQILYGQREDALTVWEQRTPDSPHRRFELAAKTVIERDRQLAAWFLEDAEQREFELAEYRERRAQGE